MTCAETEIFDRGSFSPYGPRPPHGVSGPVLHSSSAAGTVRLIPVRRASHTMTAP